MSRFLFLLLILIGAKLSASPPTKLSLEEAHRQALAHNPLLAVRQSAVDEASAGQLGAWVGFLPQISLSEQMVRSNDAVNAFGFKLKQEGFTQADFALEALNRPGAITDFQTTLEVRQPLFNGGKAFFGRRQAAAALRAARAQLERQRQETRLQTSQAYWGLVLARETLLAVRQGLKNAQAHAQLTQAHYRQELAPLSDVLAAQVRVAELKDEEIAAIYRIAAAEDGLSLVMGAAPGTFAPTDSLSPIGLDQPLAELEAAARRQRPDLRAGQAQVEAVRQGVKVERAAYLPHINAFARMDLDADTPFARQGESWTAGAIISWKLFSGFGAVAAVRQAKARRGQAEAQLRFLEQQAHRQVRQAHRTLGLAHSQIQVARQALDQAKEQQRIAKLQYQEGLSTATDLLAAETAQTQIQLRLLQALHTLNIGFAQLEFAVGTKLR